MRNLNRDLQRALQIFLRHRWWFIQALLVVVIGSVVFAVNQTPVYRAALQILVDTRDEERTSIRDSLAYALPSDAERDAMLNTHTQMMESASLNREVINTLKPTDPSIVELLPRLEKRSLLQARVLPDTNIIVLSVDASNAQRAVRMADTAADIYLRRNLYELQAKARNARQFIEKKIADSGRAIDRLERQIGDFRTKAHLVFIDHQRITVIDTLAELSKAQVYIQKELSAEQAKLATLRRQIGTDTRAAMLSGNLANDTGVRKLRESYMEAQAEAITLRLKYPPTNPLRAQAERRVQELYQLYQDFVHRELRRLPPVYPALKGPDASLFTHSVGHLESTFWTEMMMAEGRVAGLSGQLRSMDKAVGAARQEAYTYPQKEMALQRLQRDLDIATLHYRNLSQKHADVGLQEAAQFNDLRLAEAARYPRSAIWPNYPVILIVALLAGILLGLALVFTVHYLDETVHDEDVGALYENLPQLSIIPWYGLPDRPYNPLDAFTVFPVSPPANIRVSTGEMAGLNVVDGATLTLEAYRTLRANLRLLDADPSAHKVLAFLGATDLEGRASIVAGSAASFALTGERTIVVDTNFRGSTLPRILGLDNERGLSDVLHGYADWHSVIHTIKCGFVEGFSDLDIMLAGPTPLYPTELLESDQLRDLIDELKRDYELIILHTASLLTAIDGLILASLADVNLLVVGSKRVYRSDILQAKQYLEIAKIRPLGYILKLFSEGDSSWLQRLRLSGGS